MELALPSLTTALAPAQARVPVLVHRPDLHASVDRRHGELDVPVRMVDRFAASVLRIERREPQVLAVLVCDLEHAPIAEPTRWNVLHVVLVPSDVARLAGARIDDEQILVGVVEHAHHEKVRAVRRPSSGDVPRRAGDELPFGSGVEVRDDDVHVRGHARVARERDAPPVRRGRVPRQQSMHLTLRVDRPRRAARRSRSNRDCARRDRGPSPRAEPDRRPRRPSTLRMSRRPGPTRPRASRHRETARARSGRRSGVSCEARSRAVRADGSPTEAARPRSATVPLTPGEQLREVARVVYGLVAITVVHEQVDLLGGFFHPLYLRQPLLELALFI